MAHLTLEQRYTIQYLRSEGLTQSAIAEKIGKDKSVISREIRRNCDMRNGAYRADLAHRKYQERLEQKPKSHKFTEQIKETIHRLLEEDFSPKQIVGRCKFGKKTCVSHEQIYQYVWEDKRHKSKLYLHLRHKGRKYRKRDAAKDSRGRIRDTMSIDLRPPEVELKKRFGDLEMDTVVGKNHKGAILTIIVVW